MYFGEERWVCIVEQFLNFSSLVAYYVYIVAITNLWLLLVLCLIMRGRPVSKQISKLAECICVALTAIVALTVASVVQAEDGESDHGIGLIHCKNPKPSTSIHSIHLSSIIAISVCFAVDLEVVTASLLLCFAFCFIRWRMRIRTQTTALLKNSICHVGINAIVMGLDSLGTGGDIYRLTVHKVNSSRGYVEMTGVLVWNALFTLAIGVSIVVQAVLCIRTSTERDTCCKRCCHVSKESSHYAAIDGKDTAATNPASSRISQPSYTNFDVPYTGGFNTQATASIEKNEQRPLVGCVN